MRAALEERFGTTDRARIGEIVFADRDELAWLEGLLHPRVRREEERVVRRRSTRRSPATEIPLLYESGGDARFDAVVVITAPEEVRAARSSVRRRPRAAADPRRGEGAPCRLRLRERRHARGARRVRRRTSLERCSQRGTCSRVAGSSCSGADRVAALLGRGSGRSHFTQPPWYERSGTRSTTATIVLGHARNYHLDPALLAAVIYQESKFRRRRPLGSRRDRADAAPARHGEGDRRAHGRLEVPRLRPLEPEINVRYGAWYLRHLLDKYGSERLALAAYNAGQANVDRWRARGLPIQFDETRELRRSASRA